MKNHKRDESALSDFELGESVVVTGDISQAGQYGTIVGFYIEPADTLYVVKFNNGPPAHLPANNLESCRTLHVQLKRASFGL